MKTTFYFSHDIDARNDEKLQDLLMKMGYEGLGLYWSLVEMLYSMEGKGELEKIQTYAFALRTDCEKIKQLIDIVFEKNNKFFWSNTILQRLKKIKEKSKKAKTSAEKRWTKQDNPNNANEMPTHSEGNANKVNKSKVNKSKVNKSKVNKSKVNTVNGNESILKKLPNLPLPKEQLEYLTNEIIELLNDKKSEKYYFLVASKIPEIVIRQTISEIKQDGAENPAKVFTYRMEKYALRKS